MFVLFCAFRFFKLLLSIWIPVIMRKFRINWRRRKLRMVNWIWNRLVCLQIVDGFFWRNSWTEREPVHTRWEYWPLIMGLPEIQLQLRCTSLYPTTMIMTPNFPEIFMSFQSKKIDHMALYSAPWKLWTRISTITQPLDTVWYPATLVSRSIRSQVSHFYRLFKLMSLHLHISRMPRYSRNLLIIGFLRNNILWLSLLPGWE